MRARTEDQARRELRAELHAARCANNDHSTKRMRSDANALDLDLWHLRILRKRTFWGGVEQTKKQKPK